MRPGGFDLLAPDGARGQLPAGPVRARAPAAQAVDAVRALSATAGNLATVRLLTRCGVLARTPSGKYDGMSVKQLRKLAKTDPESVWELIAKYQNMTAKDLANAARTSELARDVAAAKRAAATAIKPNDPRWEGHQLRHDATAVSRDGQGNEVWRGAATSGNMTPEERALPWPESMNSSHTEVRLVNVGELPRGGTFRITGQYDPCTSCQAEMRAAANRTGCTVEYWWPGAPNGQPFRATPQAAPAAATPSGTAPAVTPPSETPGEGGAPEEPSGGGGGVLGVLGVFAPLVVGTVHNATRPGRIADKAKAKGYVPQGSRDVIEKIGDVLFDPSGEGERSVPTSARLNMSVWRQKTRDYFSGHHTGDLLVFRWDTPRPDKDDLNEWYLYILGDDGRWYALMIFDSSDGAHLMADRLAPAARAALAAQHTNTVSPGTPAPPDINDVISPNVSDDQLKAKMTDPDPNFA
jgi:hypothetical protein